MCALRTGSVINTTLFCVSNISKTIACAKCNFGRQNRVMRAQKVLYLDFDGVLHHEAVVRTRARGIHVDQYLAPGRSLFEWLPVLVSLLDQAPDWKVVLSTSWVRVLGFSRTRARLPREVQARVIGSTHHSSHHRYRCDPHVARVLTRGEEVEQDVARRGPAAWLALDDDTRGWSESGLANLIACPGDVGLSDPQVQSRVLQRLTSPARSCPLSTSDAAQQ